VGRLRVLSGRQVCEILKNHGFVEVRRRGGHVVMQKRTDDGTL
jgi:predicted RNA binding protein YcfA (HicA-like mRNA interferase family)